MNREVHYIFSIQTQDYLKSAWERGRRVYLMISPIAQCRADASGNFRKAVARGDRTAVSCLSNLQNMKGLIKRNPGTTTTTTMSCAHFLNFQLQRAWCNRLNNNRSSSRRSSCWIGKLDWKETYFTASFPFSEAVQASLCTNETQDIQQQSL